jgi:hypothetical protein
MTKALQVTTHLGDLEALIATLVFRYGPLSTREIEELVECHNQTGKYGNAETIYSNVGQAANKLFNNFRMIAFSWITGLWYRFSDENFHMPKSTARVGIDKESHFPKLSDPKDLYLNQHGVGCDYVYVVYSTDLRIESIVNRRKHFPLKVGRTTNIVRRISQLSEAGPTALTIGTLFRTDQASRLESFIHKNLKDQGQHLDIPGRREWFHSNLQQVSGYYQDFIRESSRAYVCDK